MRSGVLLAYRAHFLKTGIRRDLDLHAVISSGNCAINFGKRVFGAQDAYHSSTTNLFAAHATDELPQRRTDHFAIQIPHGRFDRSLRHRIIRKRWEGGERAGLTSLG